MHRADEGALPAAHDTGPQPAHDRYGLPADALHRDALRRHHLGLQRVHRRSRLVDGLGEGDRASQDRRQPVLVLNTGRRILVLDHQVGFPGIDVEQFAGGELMVQPIDRAVLQVGQRIMPRGAGQLMLADRGLLLPSVHLIGRSRRGDAARPVAARHGLAAVAPRGHALASPPPDPSRGSRR